MQIIYLGNKLKSRGSTPTVIDTLGPKLGEITDIVLVSDKQSQWLRLIDMLWTIHKHRKSAKLVLMDTYSTRAFYFVYLSAKLCRFLGLPYIPILHGGELPQRLDKSPEKCKEIFEGAKLLVAPSGYLRQEFLTRGYSNIVMIPNYLDLNNYPFKCREKVGPSILWVRSFHQIYNPNLAADVLKQLMEVYEDAELCMVGPDRDGSLEEFNRYALNLGVESRVQLTGRLSRKEWIGLSTEYDIFLNTTNVDNTPVSVMEAMALGMCVVTTSVGGIPFLFENGKEGLMVDPDDSQAIVQAVKDLINDPQKAKNMSEMAREKATEWDWENIKSLWEKIINENASIYA